MTKPMSDFNKSRLSDALKDKWRSGTRKKNPPETYVKSSATLKARYASGELVQKPLSSSKAKEMCAARDTDKVRAGILATTQKKIGVPNPPGKSSATPENWKAKMWTIVSPDGLIIHGKNLNYLIRTHAHLFNARDLRWKKSACAASKGIRGLYEQKPDGSGPKSLSWKGWSVK